MPFLSLELRTLCIFQGVTFGGEDLPAINLQALVAMMLFGLSLLLSRIVANVHSGKWPGGAAAVFYLRMLVGFCFTGSIVLAFYAMAGKDILSR